jgi:hypothetical protein
MAVKQQVKKVVAGHYHVTNEHGKFWVARVEKLDPRSDGVWQVGEVGGEGYEYPPFDAAPTMAQCLEYCHREGA